MSGFQGKGAKKLKSTVRCDITAATAFRRIDWWMCNESVRNPAADVKPQYEKFDFAAESGTITRGECS
jgi:hypothetical protein